VTVDVLHAACAQVGLDASSAEPIRFGENEIYRLPGQVIVRIARAGQFAAAVNEVNVSRWLEDSGVSAVRAIRHIAQPVQVAERAVTFWHELAPHENGHTRDVAAMLRSLHELPPPTDFTLPPLDPFVRLAKRIDAAHTLSAWDRDWLRGRMADLQERYAALPPGRPACVVHGDAWAGNVVSTTAGSIVLLDLERCTIGPPEWDSIHSAIRCTSFDLALPDEYAEFVAIYGHDVTAWDGFETLRDIRELRMTCMAAQVAAADEAVHPQAMHRLSCLRGEMGPRPWSGWKPVP
jgi:aminoglycoside phosphotransferase (APT) family kinase protein